MTLRLVGTCPVCARQQKVTQPRGTMVHHGYLRPGHGTIQGDCPGVGWPAYELSSEGCVYWRDRQQEVRSHREEALARLQTQPPATIDVYSRFSNTHKTYRRDSEDSNERYGYEQALQKNTQELKYSIKSADSEIARMKALIARWAPAPLVEIDEEGFTSQKRAERQTRKAERDTKRAEKTQKRSEHQARVNIRLAQRATTILFFRDEFERLAALEPSQARDRYANDVLFEAQKKKYALRWPYDLRRGPDYNGNPIPGPWGDAALRRAEQVLVRLGLARVENRPHGTFTDTRLIGASFGNKIRPPEIDSAQAPEILDAIAALPKP
jgi:hypothetical protein